MKWSPQQELALRRIKEWLADPKQQVFYLAGYAGTGKTTLAQEIKNMVSGIVCFCAFTGKAAHVLRQKGCDNATTIHSLIYITHDEENEQPRLVLEAARLGRLIDALQKDPEVETEEQKTLRLAQLAKAQGDVKKIEERLFQLRSKARKPVFRLNPLSKAKEAAVIVADECSMIGERIGRDLESFGVKILVLGDPAQLPPVGDGGYFTSREPNFLLTEIHRQARESPILRIATMAREQRAIGLGKYGEGCTVMNNSPEVRSIVMSYDQMLVGKNATRTASNLRYRTLLRERGDLAPGGPYPQSGDKLVCLRNNHQLGLLNGSLWTVRDALINPDDNVVDMVIDGIDVDISGIEVVAHTRYFDGREKEIPFWEQKDAEAFAHGYALTVHKSQGSQWDSVVLFDESWCFREERWKWLYTGITRAAKNLVVVRV